MNRALGGLIMVAISYVMAGVGAICLLLLALVLISMAMGEEADGFLVPLLAGMTVASLGLAWLFRRTQRRAKDAEAGDDRETRA